MQRFVKSFAVPRKPDNSLAFDGYHLATETFEKEPVQGLKIITGSGDLAPGSPSQYSPRFEVISPLVEGTEVIIVFGIINHCFIDTALL